MKARYTIALAKAATLACSRACGAARLPAIAAAAERAIDGRVLPAPTSERDMALMLRFGGLTKAVDDVMAYYTNEFLPK